MSRNGQSGTVLFVDDYAHHPTEVEAMLDRRGWRLGPALVVVFQPHLYSRTRDLADGFARALSTPMCRGLADLPAARDAHRWRHRRDDRREAHHCGHRDVHYVQDKADLPAELAALTKPGDLVMTMGAGDIWRYGDAFLESLTAEAS